MRLFGTGPIKSPPPLLCLPSLFHHHPKGGLINSLHCKQRQGMVIDGEEIKRMCGSFTPKLPFVGPL